MAEMLNVRVMDTGEERAIPDVEPVESAKLFWQISDGIWQQRPENLSLTFHAVDSVMSVLEARDTLNEVIGGISKKLLVSGVNKTIKLYGHRDEEVELTPKLLDSPISSCVGTFNWDERNTSRYTEIDGKMEVIAFTDGHQDRHRELYAGLWFKDEDDQHVDLTYSMQRIQYKQDRPTSLTMSIWYSRFAETGYEGNHLKHVPLSIEQELRVLRAFQAIGGITLDAATQGR